MSDCGEPIIANYQRIFTQATVSIQSLSVALFSTTGSEFPVTPQSGLIPHTDADETKHSTLCAVRFVCIIR